jgi:hypothetical protein
MTNKDDKPKRARSVSSVKSAKPDPKNITEKDEAGYGRPPKEHQFKKGQKANPNGRPKGKKSADTIWKERLNALREVNTGKGKKSMRAPELIVEGMIIRAIKGDQKAADYVLEKIAQLFGVDAVIANQLSEEDRRRILDFFETGQFQY